MTDRQIGRYELGKEIGRGGMATVHRAFDPYSKREVAIKLLPPEMLHSSEFRKRFKKELETISALEHQNIVPVYDSGEENSQPYFVMRYMTGGSLAERLKKRKLSLRETVEIIEKLALGLSYAHQKGVIHRDLKPENILFDETGNPYLSDFGVAKLMEDASSATGSRLVGTPEYASPEQAQGENDKVDHRTDVYGLGVLVYRMLTGRQPYTSRNTAGVLVKHITQPIPSILKARPDLPDSMDAIIRTAMAKRMENRYQSVLEFAHALAVAAFGPDRTVSHELEIERKKLAASARMKTALKIGGAVLLFVLAGGWFSRSYFTTPLTPTGTLTAIPSATLTITPTKPPPTPTEVNTPLPVIPSTIPTPNGGAVRIALLDGNDIQSINMDGSDPVTVDPENVEKSNLQWLADGRIVYIQPIRNCAYVVDVEQRSSSKIMCVDPPEELQGFRVSPDGRLAAVSVNNILTIVPFEPEVLKNRNSLDLLRIIEGSCRYSEPAIKDVRWSSDGRRIAALVKDTTRNFKEQIQIFNLNYPYPDCGGTKLVATDKFPADNEFAGAEIPSYDWNGDSLFLLNDATRTNRFGNLYSYDSSERKWTKITPINDSCCYRDARWSPDGKYLLFLYQSRNGGSVDLYFIPFSDVEGSEAWTPVDLLPDSFKLKPSARLEPAFQPSP